jgi:hypothetical protein
VERGIAIPNNFPQGYADLSAGIIDPQTQQVVVKFAVKERFADGWTSLHAVMVE